MTWHGRVAVHAHAPVHAPGPAHAHAHAMLFSPSWPCRAEREEDLANSGYGLWALGSGVRLGGGLDFSRKSFP